MAKLRGIIAGLIALALVVVPAHAGMYAASQIITAVAAISDCAGEACPDMAEHEFISTMPMSSDCPGMDRNGTVTPSACAAFCNGSIALPSLFTVVLIEVPRSQPRPLAPVALLDHVDPPEPYPPKI